jgi:hypothetical protein
MLALRRDAANIVSELGALREAMGRRLAALQAGQKLLARVTAAQIVSSVPGPAGRVRRGRRRRARAARLAAAGEEHAAPAGAAPDAAVGSSDEHRAPMADLGARGGAGFDDCAWRRQWRARRVATRL